jgi:hypothetical protein
MGSADVEVGEAAGAYYQATHRSLRVLSWQTLGLMSVSQPCIPTSRAQVLTGSDRY